MSSPAKIAYAASSAVSITLASLATDTNLLAGQESDAIDNTTNLYLDYSVSGHIKTGTSPTAAKSIEVWAVGIHDDTPTWPDVFDGTGSVETVTTSDIKAAICRPIATLTTDATTGRVYYFGPVSIATLFGGVVPKKFVVFVTHNTGVALDSTGGNHAITITGSFVNIG